MIPSKKDILFCIRTTTCKHAGTCLSSRFPRRPLRPLDGPRRGGIIHSPRANAAEQRTQGVNGVVDVPTYRVGDKWVYETKFDVAQLLVQANVSASLNTLTGDTVNEVTDIFYETDTNGDTVLAYEIEISGSFTSGNSGATLKVSPDASTSIMTALTSSEPGIWQPLPATLPST